MWLAGSVGDMVWVAGMCLLRWWLAGSVAGWDASAAVVVVEEVAGVLCLRPCLQWQC